MKKIIFSIIILIGISSCKEDAIQTQNVGTGIELEFLFEKDGCKVYRFFDGHYIYWSSCPGKMSYEYQQGKVTSSQQIINN
jgi:hypothetical protein